MSPKQPEEKPLQSWKEIASYLIRPAGSSEPIAEPETVCGFA